MVEQVKKLYVIGAGGHGKVAIRAVQTAGAQVVALFDDRPDKIGQRVCGIPVAGSTRSIAGYRPFPTLIAIGDNARRMALASQLTVPWATIVHPTAYVDAWARLAEGVLVLAGAVIQVDAEIGRHAIVNDHATVEHDCRVGAGAHISCGACLAGGVSVGERVLVGAGAILLPGTHVGADATIGAGTVVTKDVPAGVTVVGVPARMLERDHEQNRVLTFNSVAGVRASTAAAAGNQLGFWQHGTD